MQHLRLLDKDRNLLAIFDRHAGWNFESKINEATTMTINIPKNDDKLELVELAELVKIIKDDRIITGKIIKKEQGDKIVTLKAMTEEILLESNTCPAQYGLVYQNADLADFTRDILKGWETLRIKYQEDWQSAIEMHQVDLTTMPNKVILNKDSNGQYHSDGHIVLRFDSADIEDFEKWDRVRWVSDNSDPVSSTIQYRYGNDTSAMGSWSNEIAGALTDQLGIAISVTDRYVDVKINLYTDDTTSAGSDGSPVGVTPIAFALELIARTTAEVQEGIIPISTGKKVKNITADNSNSLELLVNACNQVGWEFEVVDGKLNLAESLGEDRANDFILKHGLNINIESLGEDDSNLCNLLHAYGPGEGINRPYVKRKDDISVGRYGLYPKTVEFDAVDKQDLEQKAQAYLDNHKMPVSEFKIKAIFPVSYNQAISNLQGVYETVSIFGLPLVKQVVSDYGEQIKTGEPYFKVGDKVKVVDPESRIVTVARIMQEKRAYTDKGIEIELHLNNPKKSLYDAIIGDEEKSDSDELELTVPQGLRVLPAQPGLLVYVNPYTNSKAAGVEIHIGTSSNFEASSKTLIRKGQGTQWYLNKLTTGNRYYIKARSYDIDKNYSEFTDEVSAIAGFIEKQQLNPNLSQDIDYAKSEADIVAANKEAWNNARDILNQKESIWDSAKSQSDNNANRLSAAETSLSQTQTDINNAETRLTTAEGELDQAQLDINNVEGRVSANELDISTINGELALKASQSTVDGIEGRVTNNETNITANAIEIATKVSQTDFNTLEGTVSKNTTSITQNATNITAKANQSEVDTINQTVSENSTQISLNAQEIALKASQSIVDTIQDTVSNNSAQISLNSQEIATKVNQTDFDTLEGTVNNHTTSINQNADNIELKASQEEVDTIEDRVSTNEAGITVNANNISSTVTRVDEAEGDITAAQSNINQNAEEITSMVQTLNKDNDAPDQFSSIKQTAQSILNIVSVLESDPESANQYSAIKQMLEQIQLRVVKDELISQINLSPESVKIQGNKIVITGDTVVEDGALSTQKLIVGNQIPMRKPNSAQLFHFDRSFLSTDGVQAQFSDSSYQLIEGKFGKALDLQTSTMTVPLGFTSDYTIVFYFWDGSDWIYVAKISDGRVFSWRIIELWSVWGIPGYKQEILDAEINVSWINIDVNGDLQVSAGYKIDELMIIDEVVDEDSIYSWYKSDAPFVDSQSVLSGGGWYSDENGLYSYDSGFKIEYDEVKKKWNAYFGGVLEGKIVKGENIEAKTIKAEQYQEIRNVLPFNYLDSLDSTHPLECDFYIPSETVNIVSVKLSAKGLPFRAYSKGTKLEESTASWVFGGGEHDHRGTTGNGGRHSHRADVDTNADWDTRHLTSVSVSIDGVYDHQHDIDIGGGYHSHNISHEHDFIFGIYEDASPANVTLQINNGSAYTETIDLGSNEILADELDLTEYFTGTGWKGIKFSSSQLGRINAQLVVKVDLTA